MAEGEMEAGKLAAMAIREAARAQGAMAKREAALSAPEASGADKASARLASAASRLDVQAAQEAWEQGGRFDKADLLPALPAGSGAIGSATAATRVWAQAALNGDAESSARMAAWLDGKGEMFRQRSRKDEGAARQAAEAGDAQALDKARGDSIRSWPALFPADGPGGQSRLAALAALEASWGWDAGRRAKIGESIAKGLAPRMGQLGPQRQPWMLWAIGELGAPAPEEHWRPWAEREGAAFAAEALRRAKAPPGLQTLRALAAIAAFGCELELLALCAERLPKWDWTVSAADAPSSPGFGAMRWQEGWSGKIPVLQAAAMGAKEAGEVRQSAGLRALMSIPEAREAAAKRSSPMALRQWKPSELAWAWEIAPEMLAPDASGRTVVHAMLAFFGHAVAKRLEAFAAGPLGFMIAQADADGASALSEASAMGPRGAALLAAYARWEARSVKSAAGPAQAEARPKPRL